MNKKKFNKVLSLYKEGASEEVCVQLIIEFTNGVNASTWIAKFYNEYVIPRKIRDSHELV